MDKCARKQPRTLLVLSDTITRMSTRGQSFRALLEPVGTDLNWVIARVPFKPEKVWKTRRGKRVKGAINGFAFRTSLFGSAAKGHCVLVNKAMQRVVQAYSGEIADSGTGSREKHKATVAPELAELLKHDRALARWFEALSYSMRRFIGDAVREPKSAETRQRRAKRSPTQIRCWRWRGRRLCRRSCRWPSAANHVQKPDGRP